MRRARERVAFQTRNYYGMVGANGVVRQVARNSREGRNITRRISPRLDFNWGLESGGAGGSGS